VTACLIGANPSSAAITQILDQRQISAYNPALGGFGTIYSSGADHWAFALPTASQDSLISLTGMSGTGDALAAAEVLFYTQFYVDTATEYMLSGSLDVDPADSDPGFTWAFARLCSESCPTPLFNAYVDAASASPSLDFHQAGVLEPGWNSLVVAARATDYYAHFDFTFTVPVPEPELAGLALFALLPLALRRLRR
jgi:hypothetical protein